MPFTTYNPYGTMQTPADAFGGTTPLESQFFTGGQIGGFPQAQYLTPYQYGSFRTLPSAANMTPPANIGIMQAMMLNSNSFLPGGPYVDTYAMGINQQKYQEIARRKVKDSITAISGSITDTILSTAINVGISAAVGGGIPGAILGLAGGIISPTHFSNPILDRIRTTRSIQNLTMSRIAVGPELDMNMGQGFNFQSARRLDKSIREMAAGDTLFKQEDYRRIMSLGLEAGMFDFSSTSSQYSAKLKVLVKNFKAMMEILETVDPTVVMQDMQRMQRMGIAPEQMTSIASRERMAARMIGISHSDMINSYGAQGALIFAQNGLSQMHGSLGAVSNAASFETMKRLGLITIKEESLMRGTSGYTQNKGSGSANFDAFELPRFIAALTMDNDLTKLDPEKVKRWYSGGYKDHVDLLREHERRLKDLPGPKLNTFRNITSLKLVRDLETDYSEQAVDLGRAQTLLAIAKNIEGFEANPEDTFIGVAQTVMKMEPLNAQKWYQSLTNPDYIRNAKKAIAVEEKNKLKSQYRLNLQSKVWSSRVGKYFNSRMNAAGEYISDSFFGVEDTLFNAINNDIPGDFFNNSNSFVLANTPSGELYDTMYNAVNALDPAHSYFFGGAISTLLANIPTDLLSDKDWNTKFLKGLVAGAYSTDVSPNIGKKALVRNKLSREQEKLIYDEATANGIDPKIFRAMLYQESGGFTEFWNRHTGANDRRGVGQMGPKALADVGMPDAWDMDETHPNSIMRFDVGVKASAKYLAQMFKQFGNYKDALQAYHDGPGRVARGGGGFDTESANYYNDVMNKQRYHVDFENAPEPTGTVGVPKIYEELDVNRDSLMKDFEAAATTEYDIKYSGIIQTIMKAGYTREQAVKLMNDPEFLKDYQHTIGPIIKKKHPELFDVVYDKVAKTFKFGSKAFKDQLLNDKKRIVGHLDELTKGGDFPDRQEIREISMRSGFRNTLDLAALSNVMALPASAKGREEAITEIATAMGLDGDEISNLIRNNDALGLIKWGSKLNIPISEDEISKIMGIGRKTSGKKGSLDAIKKDWSQGRKTANKLSANVVNASTAERLQGLFASVGFMGDDLNDLIKKPEVITELIKRLNSDGTAEDITLAKMLGDYSNRVGEKGTYSGFMSSVEGTNFRNTFVKSLQVSGKDAAETPSPVTKSKEEKVFDSFAEAVEEFSKASKVIIAGKREGDINSKDTPAKGISSYLPWNWDVK